ncbi:hypothetical protein AAE478_010200 [Parahypoxylon ruwenzoriense]
MTDNTVRSPRDDDIDDDDDSSITETSPDSPLLGADRCSHPAASPRPWFIVESPLGISVVVCLATFLWVLSGMLAIVPGTRLTEEIFCRRYYGRDVPIDEEMCKVEAVQSKVAYIFGFSLTINSIVGLVVAFPFGVLADRARKPVYLLGAAGQFLSVVWCLLIYRFSEILPIELALLGPLFEILGGGLTVATAILCAIISDVQTPENKAISYFFFSLSAQSAVFVGPPLGSKLMGTMSPWVPLYMVLLVSAFAAAIILLIPETADRANASGSDGDLWAEIRKKGWYRVTKSHFINQLHDVGRSLLVLKRRSVALILLTFMLLVPIGLGIGPTFLQYFSTRFHRKLEDAGYVLAIKGGFTIFVMAVVLPGLSKLLSSTSSPLRVSAFRRDLILARGSAVFLFIGFLALAGPDMGFVIAGLMILTLGSGIAPLCRSLITNFTQPGQTSQLFTLISMVETTGSLTAGPLLAWTFSTGMHLQGFWAGLPFLFLSALSLFAMVALCLVRYEKEGDYSQLVNESP